MGPRKLIESLKYEVEGIGYCLKTQKSMRLHLVIAAINSVIVGFVVFGRHLWLIALKMLK